MDTQILRMKQVTNIVGLSRSSIYRLINTGKFPKPTQLKSIRGVGWKKAEVEQWIDDELTVEEAE